MKKNLVYIVTEECNASGTGNVSNMAVESSTVMKLRIEEDY